MPSFATEGGVWRSSYRLRRPAGCLSSNAKVKALEIATSQQTDLARTPEILFLQCSYTIPIHLLTIRLY
jgi:hypothetical protein